ncbi:copper homeostasis protein CutC [Pragia fontium]|uniref:PF03932 family protein CutC n=2 Tax=Pragia fontium TaxID=82985 RepID=A0AAJ4WAL5_9GAMM|nr:copper homeostasis protein CutC [Pragia fontium]AKJ42406.1 copper homeostasis protein CutC [Pragia fontium]GKX61497.1 copper homeostasis protein CutC [Pragia fontium]SFC78898.1 copper homeostasis protein [Pragia fontium DSM 5563 = ATCC 49100]VEJ55603.1 Copper homeostasis protein CutC [Pragia fontium]
MPKLEVCCYSVDCAVMAERAGADRIELCTSKQEGGITPSMGMLEWATQHISIPVHPIIRPRGGDFCYTKSEFEVIKRDIDQIRELGFPGIVIGILAEDGHIDMERMQQVLVQAEGMSVTFHRAFDMCANPIVALNQLTDIGIDRILTSGQQQTAEVGLPLIRDLIHQSRGPVIMPGGGIRLTNIHKFIDAGVQEIHTTAGQVIPSLMRYRKAGVSMNTDSEADEFSQFRVDSDMVAAMKDVFVPSVVRFRQKAG